MIALLSGFSTLPLILFGASSKSDDALSHVRWYEGFSAQLWAGDLYPRWLSGMNLGLGSPAFYYYPPLPYYLTSVLRPFFPADPEGWHQVGLSAAVAVVLSGIFAFLWLRILANDHAALIGALLYTIGPYHLASDLYIRFAFAELWSFVWMPLILYFVHLAIEGNRRAYLGIAGAYALLVMTHLPTTLLFSACLLSYGVWLARRNKVGTLLCISGAMITGTGIAAIYLYPALTMEQFVFMDRMSTGYFSYANWLLPSTFGLWTSDKIVVALMTSDLAFTAVAAFFVLKASETRRRRRAAIYWTVVAVSSAVMTTDLARPVWWLVTPIQKIQFPFRFCTILTVAVAAAITLATAPGDKIWKNKTWKRSALNFAVVLMIAAWLPGTLWAVGTVWHGFYSDLDKDSQTRDTPDVPEYRTRWNRLMNSVDWETSIEEDYWDRRMNAEFADDIRASGLTREDPSRVRVDRGGGSVTVVRWQTREILLNVAADNEAIVEVGQFYFPTWSASIDGGPSDVLMPTAPHGLMSIAVPGGEHQIRITLGTAAEERIGQVISAVSLLVFVCSAVVLYKVPNPRTAA